MHKKKLPNENVIKTLINGVKSSGNQSERGLHETERISSDEYTEVNDIVQKDIYIYIYIYIYTYIYIYIYINDCLAGKENTNIALERADQLKLVLNRGGLSLKGVTFSGTYNIVN